MNAMVYVWLTYCFNEYHSADCLCRLSELQSHRRHPKKTKTAFFGLAFALNDNITRYGMQGLLGHSRFDRQFISALKMSQLNVLEPSLVSYTKIISDTYSQHMDCKGIIQSRRCTLHFCWMRIFVSSELPAVVLALTCSRKAPYYL